MNKWNKILGVGLFAFLAIVADAQQLAFPGAQGYGRFASGGRGNGTTGRVVEVTNLDDDLVNPPEGSLRWAFKQATQTLQDPILGNYTINLPLTVVFRVGGVINLKGELRVQRNNMTIAGQTAPGDGICIRGATVNFSGSRNVIVRYLRSRPGDELGQETSAFRIENGGNFIIDHCSFSWAIEETTHFSSDTSLTVQWCIISESLYNSIHKKGARGYATQWGGQYASYHHNLLADHQSRMPRINGSNANDVFALVDYRNNVNFNWGSSGAFYGGEWEGTPGCTGYSHVNVVNNYFIPGPATSGNLIAAPSTNRSGVTFCGYANWFVNGNVMQGNQSVTDNNWLGISFSPIENIKGNTEHVRSDGLLEDYNAYTQTAENACQDVLAGAGATLPKRDVIDQRVVAEVRGETPIVRYTFVDSTGQVTPTRGTGSGIIDTQRNLVPEDQQGTKTAWDVYAQSTDAPVDADHDGMPDTWELENSLDPNDITDGRKIASNGYSFLENYLNGLTPSVAVNEIHNENDFEVYPNPVSDIIHLRCSKVIWQAGIYDLTGKCLREWNDRNGITNISVDNIPVGIYLLRVTTVDQQVLMKKMIRK